jgi:hypothetical protein
LDDGGRQGGRLAGAGASENQDRAGLCGGCQAPSWNENSVLAKPTI